eukprot:COSAG02_NODE_203_length_29261_cov_20.960395_15_plen_56_part_00
MPRESAVRRAPAGSYTYRPRMSRDTVGHAARCALLVRRDGRGEGMVRQLWAVQRR